MNILKQERCFLYTVRDKNGIFIAKVVSSVVDKIVRESDCTRKIKTFDSGRKVLCLILNEDGIYVSTNISVYFWEGTCIELYEVE